VYFSGAAFILQSAGISSTLFAFFFLGVFFDVLAWEVSQKLIFDVFAAVLCWLGMCVFPSVMCLILEI